MRDTPVQGAVGVSWKPFHPRMVDTNGTRHEGIATMDTCTPLDPSETQTQLSFPPLRFQKYLQPLQRKQCSGSQSGETHRGLNQLELKHYILAIFTKTYNPVNTLLDPPSHPYLSLERSSGPRRMEVPAALAPQEIRVRFLQVPSPAQLNPVPLCSTPFCGSPLPSGKSWTFRVTGASLASLVPEEL